MYTTELVLDMNDTFYMKDASGNKVYLKEGSVIELNLQDEWQRVTVSENQKTLDWIALFENGMMTDLEDGMTARFVYTRPELTDEDRKQAEAAAKKLIRKYGYNNLPKMLAALCIENVRLTKEVNEHRAARGIDPLETYEV